MDTDRVSIAMTKAGVDPALGAKVLDILEDEDDAAARRETIATTNSVHDFATVEDGNVTVWTADGKRLTVAICTRGSQANLGAEAIRMALATYEGWS